MPPSVKSVVVRLIKEFRSLNSLVDSEVRINELDSDDRRVTAKGEYVYRSLMGSVTERGTFEISLKKSDLEPLKVRISPMGKPAVVA
jgi:hypothetical protein